MAGLKIGLLTASTAAGTEAPPHLQALCQPGTELAVYPVRIPIFAYSPAEFLIQQVNFVEAGLRAARDGCDCLVIVSVADYGIDALRAMLTIPVFGAGEALYRGLAEQGTAFTVVTVWPDSTNFIHHQLIARHGAGDHGYRIRNITDEDLLAGSGRPDAFIAQMQAGDEATFHAIVSACDETRTRDETVVLGCTCMSPLAAALRQAVGPHVIDPFTSAVLAAQAIGAGQVTPAHPRARDGAAQILAGMVTAVK